MSGEPSGASVSICIPTWQSAAFIASTLRQAQAQTHPHLRILVSVDKGDDATAAICQAAAAEDGRMQVFVQRERLGWARNANVLLDAVRTDFFCLYFHDDELAPRYVARMLRAFVQRPELVSAHCDMGHFGASDHVSRGVAYPDAAAHRLAWFLVAPERGSPLRSLTRARVLDAGLRLPTDAVDGLWANEPYLFGLLAAGPAGHVQEILYRRWDKRPGGLTEGWSRLDVHDCYRGHRANIDTMLRTLDATPMPAAHRDGVLACLVAHYAHRIRTLERDLGCTQPLPIAQIHPAFADVAYPQALSGLGAQVEAWALARYAPPKRQPA